MAKKQGLNRFATQFKTSENVVLISKYVLLGKVLSGLVQAINFEPFVGKVSAGDIEKIANVVVGAICNGRTAGGGQPLAPDAYIDDGVLNAFSIEHFTAADIPTVLEEIQAKGLSENTQFIHRRNLTSVKWQSDMIMPINLDGEPMSSQSVEFHIVLSAIKLVLTNTTPVLKHRNKALIVHKRASS
jgi:diacylglycerol kinase family enzyme